MNEREAVGVERGVSVGEGGEEGVEEVLLEQRDIEGGGGDQEGGHRDAVEWRKGGR